MNLVPNNTIKLYEKIYPNLSIPEIEIQIHLFNSYILKEGRINLMSSNYNKILRGWLMKANFEKGENQK